MVAIVLVAPGDGCTEQQPESLLSFGFSITKAQAFRGSWKLRGTDEIFERKIKKKKKMTAPPLV